MCVCEISQLILFYLEKQICHDTPFVGHQGTIVFGMTRISYANSLFRGGHFLGKTVPVFSEL